MPTISRPATLRTPGSMAGRFTRERRARERRGRLAELAVTDLAIHRSLHLLQLRGKTPSPAMAAFVQLLHQAPPQLPGYFI